MKERNNTSRIYDRAWAVIAALVALILIACKIGGRLTWSWPGMALGYAWIMCAIMFVFILVAVFTRGLNRALKRLNERLRRRKVARTLCEAMEGLTLNSVGPIYGVKRKPGEQNRDFKRRILKAARTVDTVNISIGAAGGKALNEIARQYGLQRSTGEIDARLRSRIAKAAGKPKGGKANGL